MAHVEIRLDLPTEVVALLGGTREAAARKAKQAVVLDLVREGRMSQGTAARVLGVTRHDILDLLAAYDIPSGPTTLDEYRHEVEAAERLLLANGAQRAAGHTEDTRTPGHARLDP